MFATNAIKGIEILKEHLPAELQNWHRFGCINDLHFGYEFDEKSGETVRCVEMSLTCADNSFTIQLRLLNVSGSLSFDTANGFYSGFSIEERTDTGCEKGSRFRIYSSEQDCRFELFCEKISVELFSDFTSSIGSV